MTRLDLIIWLSIALNSCLLHRSVSSTNNRGLLCRRDSSRAEQTNWKCDPRALGPVSTHQRQVCHATRFLTGRSMSWNWRPDCKFHSPTHVEEYERLQFNSLGSIAARQSKQLVGICRHQILAASVSSDDKSEQVGPTCNDYLKAYFRLSEQEYGEANKTDLLQRLSGVFPFQLRKLTLYHEVGLEPICPLVFKNSVINIFQIYKLEKTSLLDRVLQFSALDQVQGILKLNCAVRLLEFLHVYRVCIDKKLLNKNVFKYTEYVTVRGVVQSIEPDVFKPCTHLKLVRLKLYSLRTLYHSSDNSWLASINYGNDYDPSLWKEGSRQSVEEMLRYSVDLLLVDLSQEYDYPDEDFLFVQVHASSPAGLAADWENRKCFIQYFRWREQVELHSFIPGAICLCFSKFWWLKWGINRHKTRWILSESMTRSGQMPWPIATFHRD